MTGRSFWRLLAIFLITVTTPAFLRAQGTATAHFIPTKALSPDAPAPHPAARGAIGLHQLVRAAGIIFSGRVTSVGTAVSLVQPNPSTASTTVTFLVEHAVRGAVTGENLTIHEWTGLWLSGEHYCVGERMFLFLYPSSRLGLTSTVGGNFGRFAIDSQGAMRMSAQHIAAWAGDPVLGGKTTVPYADFAQAVLRASAEN
jgi:hypothetical protein